MAIRDLFTQKVQSKKAERTERTERATESRAEQQSRAGGEGGYLLVGDTRSGVSLPPKNSMPNTEKKYIIHSKIPRIGKQVLSVIAKVRRIERNGTKVRSKRKTRWEGEGRMHSIA